MIFQKFERLSDKYVKHQFFKTLIMRIVRPHITNMIAFVVPEKELSQILKDSYEELRPEFEEITIAKELKIGPTDSTLTKKILKLPEGKLISYFLLIFSLSSFSVTPICVWWTFWKSCPIFLFLSIF